MGDVVSLASRRPVYLTPDEVFELLNTVGITGVRPDREGELLWYVAVCLHNGTEALSCSHLSSVLTVSTRTIRRYSRILQNLGIFTVIDRLDEKGSPEYNVFSLHHDRMLQLALGSEWRTLYEAYRADKIVLSGRTPMSIPTDKTI